MRFLCREPGRDVWREVSPFLREPTEVLRVYDKLKNLPNLFTGKAAVEPDVLAQFFDPTVRLWTVDDVGIIAVVPHTPSTAHVHITFWDRRLRGREGLCREFGRFILTGFQLDYLIAPIPEDSRVVSAFAERVGFKRFVKVKDLILWSASLEDLHRVNPREE